MTNVLIQVRKLFFFAIAVGSLAAVACDVRALDEPDAGTGAGGQGGYGGTGGATAIGGGGDAGGSTGAGLCGSPIGLRLWTDTAAAVEDALRGRWLRCGQALTSDASEVGLEIADDLHFDVLVPGPNGTPVPSTSLFETGQVTVTPLATVNGHLSYKVDFVSDANLAYETCPIFTMDVPRKFVTTNTDIYWLTYVHQDP
jgi:hypothetical protein